MSEELHDLRVKITTEADCALEARARATGKERSEIVRDLLHRWALDEIEAASILDRQLRAKGSRGIEPGMTRRREDLR